MEVGGEGERRAVGPRVPAAASKEESEEKKRTPVNCCTICLEPWTCDGDHRMCCIIPCGHVFGRSCLVKWLGSHVSRRCPNCERMFGVEHIFNLHGPSDIQDVEKELLFQVDSAMAKWQSEFAREMKRFAEELRAEFNEEKARYEDKMRSELNDLMSKYAGPK